MAALDDPRAPAERLTPTAAEGPLYATAPPVTTPAVLTALPYFLWANRTPGSMQVWVAEAVGSR